MKIKLLIFFSVIAFFVITVSIVETQSVSVVQYETVIESVSELESSESESIADTADLVKNSTLMDMYYKSLSFSDDSLICFTLTKDIFRPPCLA